MPFCSVQTIKVSVSRKSILDMHAIDSRRRIHLLVFGIHHPCQSSFPVVTDPAHPLIPHIFVIHPRPESQHARGSEVMVG